MLPLDIVLVHHRVRADDPHDVVDGGRLGGAFGAGCAEAVALEKPSRSTHSVWRCCKASALVFACSIVSRMASHSGVSSSVSIGTGVFLPGVVIAKERVRRYYTEC